MTNVVSSHSKPIVTLSGATASRITNLNLTTAATEYSHAILMDAKKITIQARGRSRLQISFTSSESGTKYITIPRGCSFSEDQLSLLAETLYIQSDQNNEIAEILEWA